MYSLPIQLAATQLRSYKFLLLFWVITLGIVFDFIGGSFGVSYLLLEPEYLGKENFWSSYLVGSALGIFMFAYMITIYINESYRFHFIARMNNPFILFVHNNFLLPSLFLILYIYRFITFHAQNEGYLSWSTIDKTAGLLLGMLLFFLFLGLTFFTRRSIFSRVGKKLQEEITKTRPRRSNWIILGKARESYREAVRTDSFLDFPFHLNKVPEVAPMKVRSLVTILRAHHGKLLVFQISTFLLLATLGLLEENPFFQIPTGASVLLVFATTMMAVGAITFWFRKVGFFMFFIVGLLIFAYNQFHFMHDHHHAVGMNYQTEPAEYSQARIDSLVDAKASLDRQNTLNLLNQWHSLQQTKPGEKPRAILVSASGGGLRSAYWTLRVLQHADSLVGGKLAPDIRLMTGASGGMFGLTYFRELYMREIQGEELDRFSPVYLQNISKDLLNRIGFRYFTDFFLPNLKLRIDNKEYDKETGYAFDQQMKSNMPEFSQRTIGDYYEWEQSGKIPQLIITPTVLNQGKKLYISSSPISYMASPGKITSFYQTKSRGIEFNSFFEGQDPKDLQIVTALRMNATFPYILPLVELPSEPIMTVLDAGAMDNYGSEASVRFLYEFKDWFLENVEEVIFLTIRDNVREDPISDLANRSIGSKLFSPVGGGYYSMNQSRDMTNEDLIKYVKAWYPGQIEVFSFEYPRELSENAASLSFHLTSREKQNIFESVSTSSNQQGFKRLMEIYQ